MEQMGFKSGVKVTDGESEDGDWTVRQPHSVHSLPGSGEVDGMKKIADSTGKVMHI